MNKTHPILVHIDERDESGPLLERSIHFARKSGLPLILVSVIYDPYLAGVRFSDSPSLAKLRSMALAHEADAMQPLLKTCANANVEAEARTIWSDSAVDALTQLCAELDPSLLVVARHRNRAIDIALLRHKDWRLLSRIPCTLLSVARESYRDPPMIVAAVDPFHGHDKPAELDHRLIETSMDWARSLDGEVHLMHAVSDLAALPVLAGPGGMAWPVADPELQKGLEQSHFSALQKLADEHGLDDARIHQTVGADHSRIIEFLKSMDPDIVTMGAVSRGRVRSALIGNTAEAVIQHVNCDLLLVKPMDFETEQVASPIVEMLKFGLQTHAAGAA